MNKEQLKELVKQHFGLVDRIPTVTEEVFGKVFDENKAFQIVFPGDTLEVGDEVRVVTTDGQESLAPDGIHKLINGTTIKTEGSSVVEIISPEGKSEEEMAKEDEEEDKEKMAVDGKDEDDDDKEKMSYEKRKFEGPKEDISEVQGTAPQNATTSTNVPVSTLTGPVDTVADEEFKKEEMKKMKDEMKSIKDEMKAIKDKFEEFMKSPAKDKTTMSSEAPVYENKQAKQMKVMAELLNNKKNK